MTWQPAGWQPSGWQPDEWQPVHDAAVGGQSLAARRPGFLDTDGNRNKRENRYNLEGLRNDTSYRLGEFDIPVTDTADNKNRNRFT